MFSDIAVAANLALKEYPGEDEERFRCKNRSSDRLK